jgi:hypothetical protein
VQADSSLDDPPPCLGLSPGPFLELVLSSHCTPVYPES